MSVCVHLMLNITFTNPILFKSTNTRGHVPLYRSSVHRYMACHKYLRGGWILEDNTCPIWNVSGPRVLLTKQGTTLFVWDAQTLLWLLFKTCLPCMCAHIVRPGVAHAWEHKRNRCCRPWMHGGSVTCHKIQILRLTSNPLKMLDHRFCVRV